VVGEYLRYVFRDDAGHPVHGVAWESTKTPGKRSMALFFANDSCVDGGEPPMQTGELGVQLASVETRRL
jgi:hypothetical protein